VSRIWIKINFYVCLENLVLPLAVKTVFFADAELSGFPVGDLNATFEPLDVVSGPGVVADGMMICKLPFSAAAIAADTTLAGAVVEKLDEKWVKNSPGSGTFSVRAAAAAMTAAGGADETARREEADLSDRCGATLDSNDDASNAVGGDGDSDDSDDGEAAIDRPWSAQPLPNSSSRTSSLTSGGLQSSGRDRADSPDAPRTEFPLMWPMPMTLDMVMSDMGDGLDKSGQAWVVGLLIFGQDSELTILNTLDKIGRVQN
jgi:hypothetical protein